MACAVIMKTQLIFEILNLCVPICNVVQCLQAVLSGLASSKYVLFVVAVSPWK